MTASVEQQVRGMFANKPDLDEDILSYVIACLEDETFEFGQEGEEIYDTVGPMLVSSASVGSAWVCCTSRRTSSRTHALAARAHHHTLVL
jgi:hypothetical protein